jgi:hypothetical protein
VISLAGLLASAFATLVIYFTVVRRQAVHKRQRISQLGFVALFALTLLLALRFGARTYPGIFVPSSAMLNWIFNGTTLFTTFGYGCVMLGAALHAESMPLTGRLSRTLQVSSIGFALLAACISAYGFFWAAALHRLP